MTINNYQDFINRFKNFEANDLSTTKSDTLKKENLPESYLFFNGNKISFIEKGKAVKSWPAVSGRTEYQWYIQPQIWMKRYNLTHQEWSKVKNEGPTPEGSYTLGKEQFQSGRDWLQTETIQTNISKAYAETYSKIWRDKFGESKHEFGENTPMSRISWGNYRYPLIPNKGTNTFGRTSMYVHGGSLPGSIGCIDLSTTINDFQKWYKEWRTKNHKTTITVIVDYKTFDKNASMNHPYLTYKFTEQFLKSIRSNPKVWTDFISKRVKEFLSRAKFEIPKDLT